MPGRWRERQQKRWIGEKKHESATRLRACKLSARLPAMEKLDHAGVATRLQYIISVTRLQRQEVADLVGCNRRTISEMVCGRRGLGRARIEQLAVALGIQPRWLISGKGTPPSAARLSAVARAIVGVAA